MACLLTTGFETKCTDTQGGLAFVEFADWKSLGTPTYSSEAGEEDVITSFDATGSVWFKYELNNDSNNYVENILSDEQTGTTYYEQVLTLSLKKMDPISHKELKLVTYGRPHVRITDNNGNKFIMGLNNGAKVTGGSMATGGAMGDFNGYSLTLTGKEATAANFYNTVV